MSGFGNDFKQGFHKQAHLEIYTIRYRIRFVLFVCPEGFYRNQIRHLVAAAANPDRRGAP